MNNVINMETTKQCIYNLLFNKYMIV